MAILELKDVTKKFGGLTAVDGVNLKVEENQICALIGPNGAGKTTVFNMITGAYQVTSGDVIFNGESICGKKPHQKMCIRDSVFPASTWARIPILIIFM